MFCKYCGSKSKTSEGLCVNCRKNGFDFSQNSYSSASELHDLFMSMGVCKNSPDISASSCTVGSGASYINKSNSDERPSVPDTQNTQEHEDTIRPVQTGEPLISGNINNNNINNNSSYKNTLDVSDSAVSAVQQSRFAPKSFIILAAAVILAAAFVIGFASSKLCTHEENDMVITTDIYTTEAVTDTTEAPAEAAATAPEETSSVETTTTMVTVASGSDAYNFIEIHSGEELRLSPPPSENAYIANESDYGAELENYLESWLETDGEEAFRISCRGTGVNSLFVHDKKGNTEFGSISKSQQGIKLGNTDYNTAWSNIAIDGNENYGWLLYSLVSRGNINGNIESLSDGNTLSFNFDGEEYNIVYYINMATNGKQFEIVYPDNRKAGYMYIRSAQYNADISGYYVIINWFDNSSRSNAFMYMDTNNLFYDIEYFMTEASEAVPYAAETQETSPVENHGYNINNNNSSNYAPPVTATSCVSSIESVTSSDEPASSEAPVQTETEQEPEKP